MMKAADACRLLFGLSLFVAFELLIMVFGLFSKEVRETDLS
jgi:hypothetical protein